MFPLNNIGNRRARKTGRTANDATLYEWRFLAYLWVAAVSLRRTLYFLENIGVPVRRTRGRSVVTFKAESSAKVLFGERTQMRNQIRAGRYAEQIRSGNANLLKCFSL